MADEICTRCGAPKSQHTPATNGGLDCPPRADGRMPIIHRDAIVGMDYANHCPVYGERVEWVDPPPPRTPVPSGSEGGA